jgi:hypothetical protein
MVQSLSEVLGERAAFSLLACVAAQIALVPARPPGQNAP